MIRLRNALLILATLFVVGFGALVVLAKVYETEVKVGLVGALNQRLNAPVTVSDMDLTLLARFPQASMRLKDVLAKEVRSDDLVPDTLLFAKELHLEFSLWDLFIGVYTVKEIHAEHVRLYPGLDGNGEENYIVWKTDSTSTSTSPIALNKVSFNDLLVRYHDDRTKLAISSHSDALSLRGRFSEARNALVLNGDLHLLQWMDDTRSILADRAGHVKLDLEFGAEDALFRIVQGEVNTGGLNLDLTLAVLQEKEGKVLDLRANGLGLDLERTVMLLPRSMTKDLARYGMSGEVDLGIHYAGPIGKGGPSLSVGAKVTKGRMRESRTSTTFTDIFAEFSVDLDPKGVPRKLVIKGLSAKSSSGTISGNWQSTGLTNATVKAELKANVALAEVLRFAQVDTLEQVSGRLKTDLRVDGKLRDMGDIRASDMKGLRIQGTTDLRDATLKMKGVRHRVEHLNADLALNGNDATVQGLTTEYQGNPIELSGTLHNLMPYLLFADQHLVIEAKGRSPRIDLAAILSSGNEESTSGYALTLPATVELDLRATVDELVFEEFRATGISGTIRMHDRVLRATDLAFASASGNIRGDLELDTRTLAGNYPLTIRAHMDDIALKELFREFQDFGQDFIGHQHISGRANADVVLNAPLTPDMRMDMERLVCTIDIAVVDGNIKGHSPLLQVADHLQKNKLVAPFVDVPALRKELADVHFDRLDNQVMIKDGAVHIPAMVVSSSVLDIELSGTHWFDDRIDHHLNFRLSDLFRKNERAEEFGPVVDDGTGMRIFLHMYGTANDPQFSNDGAMAANKRKAQFESEKQEFKSILREELGLFKGSTEPPKEKSKDPGTTRFNVEFEAPDTARTAGAQVKKATKDRSPKPKEKDEEAPRFEVVQ